MRLSHIAGSALRTRNGWYFVYPLVKSSIRWKKCKFPFCRSVHARSRGRIKRTNNAPVAIVYRTVERAQTHEKRTCTAGQNARGTNEWRMKRTSNLVAVHHDREASNQRGEVLRPFYMPLPVSVAGRYIFVKHQFHVLCIYCGCAVDML